MEPRKASPLSWVLTFFLTISVCGVNALSEEHHATPHQGPVVEKDQRRTLIASEFGEVTAIDIKEGPKGPPYHLQFITLEPNSLFLPVLLHADMVFYVHTGSGKLTRANDDGTTTITLRKGDLCSLSEGSVFYIQSNLEAERRKLRIYAIFTNTKDNTFDSSIGAYSRINELVKGFDKTIMQAALKVPDDLIEAIINKSNTPAIVHTVSEKKNVVQELEAVILKNFLSIVQSNPKKVKTYNVLDHEPDFKNSYGWSVAVTKKQLKSLKRPNIGFFMVYLAMGSIMGPHWNREAAEFAMASDGEGMVRVVCGSGNEDETECQNMRFKVKEGDVFVVPKFHPMAHMSFKDGPLVFLGFSTSAKKNHPQFLAGKGSVLHILDKRILATSFGVSNRTIDQLLRSPVDSIIFGCSSCAEEEEKIMKEEEEEKKRKEEEERKKEEEERKREEEEERKKEEEEKKREEEERKKEEEERKREEEEEARKKEEEEAKRQQEERERKREEEEARKEREKEEEEARRQEEEKKEREEEMREREKEKAAAKREQEKRKREQEAEAKREQEQARREAEAAAKREQERAKREEEKRERRRQEEGQREEGEGDEEPTRREKGKTPEEGVEWELEEAMRPQEQRESDMKNREVEEQRHGSSFQGRRVLKTRKI